MRSLSANLAACFMLFCGAGVAQDTSCLAIDSVKVDSDRFGFKMNLTNRCGKEVTAYGVAAMMRFSDGRTAQSDGMRQEYLPSLVFPTPDLERGPIGLGYTRETPFWGLPRSQTDIDKAVQIAEVQPRIRFIIFLDCSAAGDETGIDQLFASRRFELQELRYWKDALLTAKSAKQSPVEILQIGSKADLTSRTHFDVVGGALQRILGTLRTEAESKAITPQTAVERFENYLDARIAATATHSVRVR